MKEQLTGKTSVKGGATDWERLRNKSDKGIRGAIKAGPEALPTDVDFWKQAKVVLP